MSRVWLIGAGPGDPELITLKAVRALAAADVVLVDDLVNPEVLQHARADAEIVYVGKRGGSPSTSQQHIIATMLAHLQAGRSVARLKGGDPFVFGRGGEELLALQAAGIAVEIVSGVTAGIAAPAALGIPVTHRGLAQGAIFVTGHSAGGDEPDWAALVATGLTLVVYMGIRRLEEITERLLQAGLPPRTPCAAIESATLPAQSHLLATLDTLPRAVQEAGLGSPAIVVIGDVVSLVRTGADALQTRVRPLTIGFGFRRDVTLEQIEAAVRMALAPHGIAEVACIATLQTKAHEPALQAFCEQHRLPLVTFSAQQINACLDDNPSLARSTAAREHAGVDGVCEPCALLALPGARLLHRKAALDAVTVAIGTLAPPTK
jgi:uroporphyrin-III C-methyltransferase